MKVPIQFGPQVLEFDEATYDADGRQIDKILPPGAAYWMGNGEGNPHACLEFTCPCGCGIVHCISVTTGKKQDKAWLWDGNVEKPTLSPSIQANSPCKWHGYLKAGVWERC